MLHTLLILLAAAALAVPLTRRLGFGSVLGYLLAGVAIGPAGAGLVTNVDAIAQVASLGVVMLLFLIGLEVRPRRLWVMRRSVFGLGTAQVVAATAVLAGLAHLAHQPWPAAIVLGAGFALSSTAIVLPMLAERDLLASPAGRDAFAVLLFQDLAFIPLVALVPLLGDATLPDRVPWLEVARGVVAIAIILGVGRFLVRPAFRAIGGARTPEVFTTLALLTVAGAATLADAAGLSLSLGAFLAGVLLSDSEYRPELQADIEPFEGLLLGFFFISVGMSARLELLEQAPVQFLAATAALLAAKIVVGFGLGRLAGRDSRGALRFALALPQGSEFSFIMFAAAVGVGALGSATAQAATLVVALTMIATPFLFAAGEALLARLARDPKPEYDAIPDTAAPVIIAGFGRVGQIVGRVLRTQRIAFTALERDPGQLAVVRRFGGKVYFGDPARPDLLRAAGAEHARVLVVAVDDVAEALKVVEVARRTFPGVTIVSRARNRRHAHLLMERGIGGIVRDTFHSSLRLSALVMNALDMPADRVERAVKLFEEHDERLLVETLAIWRDEKAMIQNAKEAAEELTTLFEADRPNPEPAQ